MSEKKRRIEMEDIAGITISKITDQFIVHCKNDEYDYLYISPNRLKIIEILETVYEANQQTELLFYIATEKDLTKYVINKNEKRKTTGKRKRKRNRKRKGKRKRDRTGKTKGKGNSKRKKRGKKYV